MNSQELLNQLTQEYPWVSTDLEEAEAYIRDYPDYIGVHMFYDYLLTIGIANEEDQV